MSRWKAAGIHLVLSIALGVAAFLLLFLLWYPGPLFEATGGDRLVVLLVTIDIVIGPLITLVVFRSGKWGMKFDLVVIGVLQVAALLYGLHVILAARPAFLVFAVDRITAVSANALDDADLAQASEPAFRSRPWTGPLLVAAEMPTDTEQANAVMFSALAGKDIDRMPRYYRPYAAFAAQAAAKRHPLAGLRAKDAAAVDAFVAAHGGDGQKLGYLPLVARNRDMAVVLDDQGAIVGYLQIDPW